MTNNINLVFAGLARDCEEKLVTNISFLQGLINFNLDKFKINVFILENDSEDNTKNIIKTLEHEENFKIFTLDGLNIKITNRIERITYCRNYLLNKISLEFDSYNGKILLIPLDLDIDLFSLNNFESFTRLLEGFFIDNDMDAIFPNSIPNYYDIHALRADNWNCADSWKKVNKLSKYLPIGKFFIRYFLIYKKQLKLSKFNKKIKVESAFGGIGLYKISNEKLKKVSYKTDALGNLCEHVEFNKYFNQKYILPNWIIEAPKEHLEFKLNTNFGKVVYIIKNLSSEFKKLLSYIIKI